MSGVIIEEASMSIPLLGTDLDDEGIISDNEISKYIKDKLNIFRNHIVKCEK